MTKTALTSQITSILTKNGIELSSTLAMELLGLSAPKTPQRVSANLPLVGTVAYDSSVHSIDDITSVYCIRFDTYFPVTEFSKSTKTTYGYSKESKKGIKLWLHYDKKIKDLESDVLLEKNAVMDGVKTVEEAKEAIEAINLEITSLKELRSSPYSLEIFDSIFSTKDTVEVIETKESVETKDTKKDKKSK